MVVKNERHQNKYSNINTTEKIGNHAKKILTTTPLQYPCWHDWQPSASKRNPSPLPNLPGIHGMHVVSFNAAKLFEYIPEIHAVHSDDEFCPLLWYPG